MGLLFNYAWMDYLAIFLTLCIGIYSYFKFSFKYWHNRGLPYLQTKIPFGSLKNAFVEKQGFGEQIKDMYNQAKSKGYNHVGLYTFATPIYMPIDPEYIRNIMAKDFDHFVDRGAYFNEKDDPLSAHLFSIEGAKWKNLRMKLTPTFTTGKMKMMFHTLVECGEQLKDFVGKTEHEPLDIKDALGRYTTDVIGSCAFGLKCNSFQDPNSEFRKNLKRAFQGTTYDNLKGLFAFSFTDLCRKLRISITPKELTEFIMGVVKDTVEFREKNNVVRNDFMQLLLALKDNQSSEEHDGNGLTIEQIAAQAFIFLFAGYETSSSAMTFCLFELALQPDLQQKVREEINSVLEKHNGNLTYDAIMEMKYMGQVVDETLRKYPPVPILMRKCVADYKVPDSNVMLEKGTRVFIALLGMHHDEEHFPDPQKFDPERFSEQNKNKIKHFTYMPFGEGPRVCIGVRFGIMQTKVGLAMLLKNYIFTLNSKTTIPLKMDPGSFILSALGDIWLNIEKVEE